MRESRTLRLSLRADLINEEIHTAVVYVDPGGQDRAKLNRYLSEAGRSLPDRLKAAGWRVLHKDGGLRNANHSSVDAR